MAIAAVTILFALGPIIVNQAFAYGGFVGYGSYTVYVGYHHLGAYSDYLLFPIAVWIHECLLMSVQMLL